MKCASFDSFPLAIVTSLLHAMNQNSLEARQRFPRLLQIIEYYPETMDAFMRKVCDSLEGGTPSNCVASFHSYGNLLLRNRPRMHTEWMALILMRS